MEGGVGVGGGGPTLSDMYQRSKKLSIQIRDGLERLESSPSIVADAPPPELSFSIKRGIVTSGRETVGVESECLMLDIDTEKDYNNGDSSHVLRIFNDEVQAMQSARNSHVMVDEAYNTGIAILSKFAEQRDTD
ncbi:Membrin-11 [Acorus calamus]|uniref:Membrin-11 n=1 Tax=Acorus calamus TaxID=4465 RepID=A0AAV9EBS2_ACOCL|nr:Membrin-11 [Acorus calamus]